MPPADPTPRTPLELVLILHLELPPGSDREACDRAWDLCFGPLLGALHETPDAACGLVLAGELIQELEQRHPEAIEWVRELVDRGQVELLGTALYEPVLTAIPERDAIGQFGIHAAAVRKTFGVRPTGCWVPHGMWEPTLPRVLGAAGMKWAVVPDVVLEAAGVEVGRAAGVYRTEREGHPIALLPRDTAVSSVAAEVPVRDVVAHLTARAQAGDRLVTVGLHGTRFGLHPGSSPRRDRSWLATLLSTVARLRGILEPRLPSQAVALGADQGRIYLPASAPFGCEPPWEKVLVRYDAADRLHKKMLRVSRLVEKLDRYADSEDSRVRPDPGEVEQARRYLYRSQASAAYWHDPHAGLYDTKVRERAWRDVLRGEHAALQTLGAADRLIVDRVDLDGDGTDEILLYTPDIAAVVAPFGGSVIELSPVAQARNLADVLTRVEEPYHSELPEGDPRRAWLGADRWPRALFRDRFVPTDTTLAAVGSGAAAERATGLTDRLWEVVAAERHGTDAVRAILRKDGVVADARGDARIRVEKRYTMRGRVLSYREEITNRSREVLRVRHAVVLDLFLGSEPGSQRVVVGDVAKPVTEPADRGEAEIVRLEGNGFTVSLALLQPALVWHLPVRAVHRAHGEWHATVQGLSLWLIRDLVIDSGRKSRFDGKIKVER